ncbi:MAG: DHH family phosphoesterase [Clostridia bacterium]|nr:DHH family phosphoesterase [Clostridia bacterium]
MNNLRDVAELLKSSDKIEIFTHIHPDGDALGSAYALASALKKLGKTARVTVNDTLPKSFAYIHEVDNPVFTPSLTVTVDVASPSLLGDFPSDRIIDLAIDHHSTNTISATHVHCEPDRAACGEIIFELINELGVEPDRYIAECLYTAIATDTGCFKFSNTTANTFETAAKLCKYAPSGNFGYLNTPLFITKSRKQISLEAEVLSSLLFLFDGKVAVATVTNALLEKIGLADNETAGVEQLAKLPEGVLLGITLKERPDGFKVSMRSTDSVDCSKICAAFGGGGHHSASGCFFSATAEETVKALCDYLEKNNILG